MPVYSKVIGGDNEIKKLAYSIQDGKGTVIVLAAFNSKQPGLV